MFNISKNPESRFLDLASVLDKGAASNPEALIVAAEEILSMLRKDQFRLSLGHKLNLIKSLNKAKSRVLIYRNRDNGQAFNALESISESLVQYL